MIGKISPKRGQIWFVDLDPVRGHEQAKKRPCLVVSINSYNNGPHELATILPITSKYRSYLWYIELKPEDSGLQKISYVITDQVRTLSLERFHGSAVGNIDYRTLAAIEFRLRSLLGLLDYSI